MANLTSLYPVIDFTPSAPPEPADQHPSMPQSDPAVDQHPTPSSPESDSAADQHPTPSSPESDSAADQHQPRPSPSPEFDQVSIHDQDSAPHMHSGDPKPGNYFYYESPLYEDTGDYIPVSVRPMSEHDHAEWKSGFISGGYLPDGELSWDDLEDKQLTLWDVFSEMLFAAQGKVTELASGDLRSCRMGWFSPLDMSQAWLDFDRAVKENHLGNIQEVLDRMPPRWLSDSTSTACMLCNARFHPIMCSRHHCRLCGGLYCGDCTKGRSLLPPKFRTSDPQRVCDVCFVKLDGIQSYLQNQVSRAAQPPTHDLTDLSTLRSWLNFPWGQSMEDEIYKAANTIRGYTKVGLIRSEKAIPDAILKQAKGLAILTVANVGVMVTYKIGTGLVIVRREDGSWSPPSAISSFGLGWGAQAGGEFTDFIIVLRNTDAIRTFSGDAHLSVGAGVSAAAGIVGRSIEADFRAGDGGYAACYTYSCSKGAFVGCSLNGSVVTTRNKENSRFYGKPSIKATEVLLGSLPKPPAAAVLYNALTDLFH